MHSNTQWNFEILFGFQLLPRPDMIFIRWTSKRLRKLRSFPAHRETLLVLARRHLLPTLKNALLFACAQMGGFGLGEQVVRVKVILFIGLSPPGNTNEFNPELLVISCRGGMSAYPFGLQTLSQRTFASYRRCRKTRRREGRLKSFVRNPLVFRSLDVLAALSNNILLWYKNLIDSI